MDAPAELGCDALDLSASVRVHENPFKTYFRTHSTASFGVCGERVR
jgi:hypothetical protein